MEKSNSSGALFSLKMGGILGIVLIIYTVILHALEQNENVLLGLLSYVLMLVIIGYATKSFRDEQQDGYLTYGEGVKLGFLISLFGGILIAAFTVFLIKKIDPSIEEDAVNKALEDAVNRKTPESQLEMVENWTRWIYKPVPLYFLSLITTIFIGVIESLIVAAIFKKKRDPFESAMKDVEN